MKSFIRGLISNEGPQRPQVDLRKNITRAKVIGLKKLHAPQGAETWKWVAPSGLQQGQGCMGNEGGAKCERV